MTTNTGRNKRKYRVSTKAKADRKDYWNEEVIRKAMKEYRLAHTVTKKNIPGQQKKDIQIVLNNPDDGPEWQMLYRKVIYPAHERLVEAYLKFRKIDADHREEMTGDILSYLYQVLMLYWNPHKDASSYSYFVSSISTRISHYYKGTLACSPQWAKEKDHEFILTEHDPGDQDIEELRQELIEQYESLAMTHGEDFHVEDYHNGKKLKVVQKRRTQRHHLDSGDDIAQIEDLKLWDSVCIQTLSEYIPDVVIAKKYHTLAFAILDIVKEIINDTYSRNSAQRLDFWLLSRIQLEVGYAVTKPDLKMAFYVIRTALGYYLDDFPVEGEAEYGDCGLIYGLHEEF